MQKPDNDKSLFDEILSPEKLFKITITKSWSRLKVLLNKIFRRNLYVPDENVPDIDDLAQAYKHLFDPTNRYSKIILEDLMVYCKFIEPCEDDVDEGKRRVYLHILSKITKD